MNLNLQQLSSHLQKSLKPVYLFSGDEILLMQESSDTLRTSCKQQGFIEREVFDIDTRFDWSDILQSLNSMSLFADKKLIEIRFKTSKIGDDGSKGLVSVIENTHPDIAILVTMPKIDKATQNSKWFKAIDNIGITLQVWPIERAQLPRWIQARMEHYNLKASDDALQFLADNVEGNLLAAQQEIEKLRLQATTGMIDLETMTSLICNSSRYNVFSLADHCLAGDVTAAMRTLNGLKAEDDTPKNLLPILGFLARELRTLHRLQTAQEQGTPLFQAMQNERIFQSRQNMVQNALKRMSRKRIEKLLAKARRVDQSVKGLANDSPWLHLEQLTLAFSRR